MNLDFISNIIGMLGVSMIVSVYFLSQIGRCSTDSWFYLFSNFIGALFIIFPLFFHWNLASFSIEIAWLIITVIGVVRKWRALS